MPDLTLTDRLLAVFDALGISRGHIATQSPADIAGLVAGFPERVSGIGLLAPPRIEPSAFVGHGSNVLYIAPSGGTLGRTAATVLPHLPNARTTTLEHYDAESWSDIAADCPAIADLLIEHLSTISTAGVAGGDEASGEIAGIRYHIVGGGPVLVLTPLAFAPSQWQPLLPTLAQHFRVVALSGPHLGMLALLEQRAALSGWQHMCSDAFDALDIAPRDSVLEVGCGSGAIARRFIHHTDGRNPLTAIDLSPYLLSEARLSAEKSSHPSDIISFAEASAEDLPIGDNSFDAAYTITVLEECNAERAIAELIRVVKPGGRIAIIVRGIDLPQWWNMPLNPEIRAKIAVPASSVSPNGVATAVLYDLAKSAGLKPLRMYPYTVASESIIGPVFEFPETHALSLLTPDEQAAYHVAKTQAISDGTIFMTRGHHCFIGEVPG